MYLSNEADCKRKQLLSCLNEVQECNVEQVAGRILANVTQSVRDEAAALGSRIAGDRYRLEQIFKRPLPYDACDQRKPAVMPELMLAADGGKLSQAAYDALESTFDSTPQSTPMVLVTGVSGMGKTKVAYDIGQARAFVILSRIVERDKLTLPWFTFIELAQKVVPVEAGVAAELPVDGRRALVGLLVGLLVSYLQWPVQVCEAAAKHQDFPSAVQWAREHMLDLLPMQPATRPEVPASEKDARTWVFRQVTLRAQRNGLAYRQVNNFFCDFVRQVLFREDAVNEQGCLNPSCLMFALDHLAATVARANSVWEHDRAHIVWAHDEVQALLGTLGLPENLFQGVYRFADTEPADGAAGEGRPPTYGCFYGLLAAIREIMSVAHCGHLLLGNNLRLSDSLLSQHSPAQGRCATIDMAIHLEATEIRA